MFVRAAFAATACITGVGVWRMPLVIERKGFLSLGTAYLITSTLTLCKVIRDREEARKLSDAASHGIIPRLGVRETIAALKGSTEYTLSAFLSWLVATLATAGGIRRMPL